jgi:hypothetical protein
MLKAQVATACQALVWADRKVELLGYDQGDAGPKGGAMEFAGGEQVIGGDKEHDRIGNQQQMCLQLDRRVSSPLLGCQCGGVYWVWVKARKIL